MRLSIIVAMDDNQLIGQNNTLPWHLPADLAYFKKTTSGKAVLMGRKTYDSIGRPLPKRTNIILTRKKHAKIPGCKIAKSIKEALHAYKEEEEIFIIGGMSVYEQFMNLTITDKNDLFASEEIILIIDRLYITQIEGEFAGDAHFPEFDRRKFIEISRETHEPDEKNKHRYHFTILDRK
ncbi:Dihydrofolate reductase [uncultured Candidatus Thioglobus sp.]|nr:Dihydrofolate reductase [uncultured Candidatus Thioglobus sp.]